MQNSRRRIVNIDETVMKEMENLPNTMREELEERFTIKDIMSPESEAKKHFHQQIMRIYPKEVAYREVFLGKIEDIIDKGQ